MKRRHFLKVSAAAAASATMASGIGAAEAPSRNGMPYRVLGRTGEEVSLLCIGGYHVARPGVSDDLAIRIMRTAIDEGVNFLDNAWDYNQGRSEQLMGKALKNGYRDRAFVMTKVLARDPEGVGKQLEDSLRRLDIDRIDLWQFHSLRTAEDARQVCEELLEIAVRAREAGKVRYIGFTGHRRPEALAEMMKYDFPWDAVQMATPIFDYHHLSFQRQVLPLAVDKNVGVIAMKPLAGRAEPHTEGLISAEQMWRYTMSLPVASVVTGLDTMEYLQEAIRVFRETPRMEAEEKAQLLALVREEGESGRFEYYKRW
jgi:uncharacterized protein